MTHPGLKALGRLERLVRWRAEVVDNAKGVHPARGPFLCRERSVLLSGQRVAPFDAVEKSPSEVHRTALPFYGNRIAGSLFLVLDGIVRSVGWA